MWSSNANKMLWVINAIVAVCLFVGCSPRTVTTSVPLPSATFSPLQTSSISTQQSLVDPVEKRCVTTALVEQFSLDASLVLMMSGINPSGTYIYDLLVGTKKELHFEPDVAISNVIISPNRKLAALAISTVTPPWQTPKLLIIDAAGVIQKEIEWQSEWGRVATWLDNHRILIARSEDLQSSIYNPETIILLDINTGQVVDVQVTYPDINYIEYVNWNLINYIYSQDFTRVLYPTSKVDPGYINYVALWDLTNEQVLATLPVELSETSLPQWSPEGSQLLISGLVPREGDVSNAWRGQELFVIDKDGTISQLTHFTDYYPGTVSIEKYIWSPDGKNIAFWLQTEQMDLPQLVTYNIATGNTTNHCISALPYHAAIRPIWSPLGDYLLIVRQESMNTASQALLMNVSQNTVAEIGEGVTPIAWMVP